MIKCEAIRSDGETITRKSFAKSSILIIARRLGSVDRWTMRLIDRSIFPESFVESTGSVMTSFEAKFCSRRTLDIAKVHNVKVGSNKEGGANGEAKGRRQERKRWRERERSKGRVKRESS